MAEFTRTPDASSEKYPLAVRTALLCAAMGDALGYPLELLSAKEIAARSTLTGENELIFSDDTQLSCYTLDALTEVLEWNNQGTPADELACLWLVPADGVHTRSARTVFPRPRNRHECAPDNPRRAGPSDPEGFRERRNADGGTKY